MGMADFYLKINFKKHSNDVLTLYRSIVNEKIFRILEKEYEPSYLSLECKFDNFIPSIIIAFDNLYLLKDQIVSIETHGIVTEFMFDNIEEFLNFVFSANKNKLMSYHKQMGYLSIDSNRYYRKRVKLKKYYKQLK